MQKTGQRKRIEKEIDSVYVNNLSVTELAQQGRHDWIAIGAVEWQSTDGHAVELVMFWQALFRPGEQPVAGDYSYVASVPDLLTAKIGDEILQAPNAGMKLPNDMQYLQLA